MRAAAGDAGGQCCTDAPCALGEAAPCTRARACASAGDDGASQLRDCCSPPRPASPAARDCSSQTLQGRSGFAPSVHLVLRCHIGPSMISRAECRAQAAGPASGEPGPPRSAGLGRPPGLPRYSASAEMLTRPAPAQPWLLLGRLACRPGAGQGRKPASWVLRGEAWPPSASAQLATCAPARLGRARWGSAPDCPVIRRDERDRSVRQRCGLPLPRAGPAACPVPRSAEAGALAGEQGHAVHCTLCFPPLSRWHIAMGAGRARAAGSRVSPACVPAAAGQLTAARPQAAHC